MKKIIFTLMLCFCFVSCHEQAQQIKAEKSLEKKELQNFELVMHPYDSELYVYKTIIKDANGQDKTVVISYTSGHGGIHSSSMVDMVVLENN